MFGVLVESNPRPGGRRGVAVVSVAVHVGLILLGVWATAESLPPTSIIDRETTMPEIFPQPAPTPLREPASPRPPTETGDVSLPDAPTVPSLRLQVPDRLPPVEETLGEPFARTYDSLRVTVSGRSGAERSPGSVWDNRAADKPALPLAGNQPPAYPALLRSASIEGAVEVEFVIDPNGKLRTGSIVALHADHPRFLDSVRQALPQYRYLPAEVAGRPVAVRVRQRFEFKLDG